MAVIWDVWRSWAYSYRRDAGTLASLPPEERDEAVAAVALFYRVPEGYARRALLEWDWDPEAASFAVASEPRPEYDSPVTKDDAAADRRLDGWLRWTCSSAACIGLLAFAPPLAILIGVLLAEGQRRATRYWASRYLVLGTMATLLWACLAWVLSSAMEYAAYAR